MVRETAPRREHGHGARRPRHSRRGSPPRPSQPAPLPSPARCWVTRREALRTAGLVARLPSALPARCAAAGLLLDARRAMGDVVVVTHDASVARWAEGLCAVEGPGGTRLWLEPVVLQLTLAEVDALLAPGRAELALFAAWAVHDQSGARARAAVERAAETILAVEDPALRDELIRAMLTMLGDPFRRIVQEILSMKPLVLPEDPLVTEFINTFQTRGKEEGKADALLQLLTARGVAVDDEARARILACRDLPTLDRWFLRAVTATSTAAVLADN